MVTKIALSIICIFTLSFSLSAQEKTRKAPADRAKMMTEKMAEKLELTADQKEKVYQVNLQMAESAKAQREQHKENREKHNAALKEILTEDQFQKFTEVRKAKSKEMRAHPRKMHKRENMKMKE